MAPLKKFMAREIIRSGYSVLNEGDLPAGTVRTCDCDITRLTEHGLHAVLKLHGDNGLFDGYLCYNGSCCTQMTAAVLPPNPVEERDLWPS